MIDTTNDLLPVVDEEGNILSSITRKEAHGDSMQLHPVVHLHVFNSKGELLLQKRPQWKDIQPGRWDTAVGGHVDLGESIHDALRREVKEEIGITDFEPQTLKHYVFESDRERELVFVHLTTYDGPLHPDTEELDDLRFWRKEDILQNLGRNIFTPNFESEYQEVISPFLAQKAINNHDF